jgi:hypothetical protein
VTLCRTTLKGTLKRAKKFLNCDPLGDPTQDPSPLLLWEERKKNTLPEMSRFSQGTRHKLIRVPNPWLSARCKGLFSLLNKAQIKNLLKEVRKF